MKEFFNLLFRFKQPDELIVVEIYPPGKNFKERYAYACADGVDDELIEFIQNYAEEYNCFFGVNPRKSQDGDYCPSEEKDVSRVTAVWVDIDDLGEGMAAIKEFILPPTVTVGSGHGVHAYWLLKDNPGFATFKTWYKHEWAPLLGADHTGNVNRLMRIPGTKNVKNPDEPRGVYVFGDVDKSAIYSFDDIVAAVRATRSRGKHRYNSLHETIMTGDASEWDGDRSDRDFWIACELLRNNMSEEGVFKVMTTTLAKKKTDHHDYEGHYLLEQTIPNARRKVGSTTAAVSAVTQFTHREDGTYYENEQIATWTFEPTLIVHHDEEGDAFCGTLNVFGRTYRDVTIPVKSFVRRTDLRKEVNVAGAEWLGSDKKVPKYHVFLHNRAKELGVPVVDAVDQTGLHGDYFISKNQVLGKEGFVEKEDADHLLWDREGQLHMPTVWTIPQQKPLEDFLRDLHRLLPAINEWSIVWPVWGWLCATPFKQALRDQLDVSFPFLNVWGEKESGKTAISEKVISRLVGYDRPNSTSAVSTNFTIEKKMGSSNALLVHFEEYRVNVHRQDSYFEHFLRQAYDQSFGTKGHWPRLIEYPLTAPVLVTGEDPLLDRALKDRVIQVNPKPSTIKPGTSCYDAFYELVQLPLEWFAAPYFQFVLQAKDRVSRIFPVVRERVDSVFSELAKERLLNNIAVTVFGMEMLRAFYAAHGIEWELTNEFIRQVMVAPAEQVTGANLQEHSMADAFVEAVVSEIEHFERNGGGSPPFTYEIKEKSDVEGQLIFLHKDKAFRWFQKETFSARRDTLSAEALNQQLEERIGTYLLRGGPEYSRFDGKTRYFTWAIKVRDAVQYGLDIPEEVHKSKTMKVRMG